MSGYLRASDTALAHVVRAARAGLRASCATLSAADLHRLVLRCGAEELWMQRLADPRIDVWVERAPHTPRPAMIAAAQVDEAGFLEGPYLPSRASDGAALAAYAVAVLQSRGVRRIQALVSAHDERAIDALQGAGLTMRGRCAHPVLGDQAGAMLELVA